MTELCSSIESGFVQFYHGVYREFSEETSYELTSEDISKIVGVVHSIELVYADNDDYTKVAGIIVNTALDHLLINGNKRLSLILGYYCCHHYGYTMLLLEGNFPRLIKEVVIAVETAENNSRKMIIRNDAIEALAKELRDFTIKHDETDKPDESILGKFFNLIRGKV